VDPDDRRKSEGNFARVVRGETAQTQEQRQYINREGHTWWAEITSSAIRDEAGCFLFAVRVVQDITSRRMAEEALQTSEKRHRVALQAAEMATWDFDIAANSITWNEQHFRLFGVEPDGDEKGVEDFLSYVHPEDLAGVRERLRSAVAESGVFRADFRIIRRDNRQVRWMTGFGQTTKWEDTRSSRMTGVMFDTTERRRMEEAVRASEERLRTLANAVPQIIWANSADGTANYFNLRWFEYTGLSLEESIGPGWQRIVHPDDAADAAAAWTRALQEGEAFDCEYRLRGADGEYRWFIGRNIPLREADGHVSSWFGTATDIQDLKQAEAALRASEEQFRRAIEEAPIPVIMHAEDGQVLQISRTWTELTGYGAEDTPTFDAWLNHAYGEGADEVRSHVQELFSGDVQILDAEIAVQTSTGQTRTWSFSASAPGVLHDGRRFIVGMALDITERREVEEALRRSEEHLRLILENATEYAIITMDLDRRVLTWNQGAQRLLGYAEEEIVGTSGDIIFTREDRARGAPVHEAETALFDGRAADERWHVRKDGSVFWGSGVMTRLLDGNGDALGLVKIFRDQTEQRRAQEALERSQAELWTSLKETERAREAAEAARSAKDHFFAVLSHELRTPLTPVVMAVHTLSRQKDLPPMIREALEMIERNIQLEARFIDDLLDATRIERGKLELDLRPIDLHEVLQHAAEVVKPDIDAKGQRFTVALEPSASHIIGDKLRLQQVFWNLLKNAAKFTSEGGMIVLRSRNESGKFVVTVADNGMGFVPEIGERLFDAFQQSSIEVTRKYGGLGLGLAIAKAVVAGHGGTISAHSAGPGEGATFTVSLPLSSQSSSTTSASA
jgi:PAS domain S-box-containing protein